MAKPKLAQVGPFEWEGRVRHKHTQDPPVVLTLYRMDHMWHTWHPGSTKLWATKAEALDFINTEYEGV